MINPLQLLKQNAPGIYQSVCISRTTKLNAQILDLRLKYQSTENIKEKEAIKFEAERLKAQLEDYKQ